MLPLSALVDMMCCRAADMSTSEMVQRGKMDIAATDKALTRSERVVEDTIAIATSTAETLHKQVIGRRN